MHRVHWPGVPCSSGFSIVDSEFVDRIERHSPKLASTFSRFRFLKTAARSALHWPCNQLSCRMIVDMDKAKNSLSELLNAALAGEEVIIAKSGKPLARLLPIISKSSSGRGRFAGKIKMDGFFDPLDEKEMVAWEG
jgi:prevent-host-death family protein